ncbi:protein kinase domain-containing protein [Rhodococcus daqingensis]|uniref:Serine/threonine-protein kinase PknK n=1 Tax=Rhodococcus daqingensis TaxID=2479363 RepID=A0ABW2RY26_9NOCA
MADIDPQATQREMTSGFAAELAAAGYEDAHEIGRGGFGVVYRCLQRDLDRIVAVKVLTSDLDSENLERFLREQRAMGRLSGHPNIVKIFQVGATGSGRPFIVMQYHARDSLDARIRHSGPLEWPEAIALGVKIAGALETAHRLGTLHRDVKPANILVTDYGEPQLTDFGIARVAGGFETTTGAVTGSPAFTAPEVLEGHPPTPASDVYSLGATLFCAITGHAAFERRSGEQVVAQFLRITTRPIPDLRGEGIPEDVCAVLERAMAREAADRPATAAELGDELRAVQDRHGLIVDELPVAEDELPVAGHGGPHHDRTSGRHTVRRGSSGRITTPPAPATRFRPPTPNRPLVTRGRLIDLLQAGRHRQLTVIHAPAGFGKSTLAAQWCGALDEEGVAVAWLTVDHDDDNVVWFLAHLIEAIRRVRPTLARDLGDALEEHGDEAERYVLTTLVDEIHENGERVAVVIDDWHRVTSAETVAALAFLLDNGCQHLQLVVVSRTQAGIPMSRMRVRDELVEIGSGALRFDTQESRVFLVDLGGLELDDDDVRNLTESTGGWVAAMQLASLSLRESENPAELIENISGRHHAIGEFLAENVLDTVDPEILDFLLATSVTDRICGSLASVLAGVSRGQALLEAIEERDLFLDRMDDDRHWFRYAPLFAEFLRRRLERDRPDAVEGLHRTASEWFADHQFLSEAVDHALAAGDDQRAVELVERDGVRLLEFTQTTTLLGSVDKLPPAIVASSPRLQLIVAWANILLHRIDPAQQALTGLDTALERSALTEGEVADLRIEADVVRSVMELRSDRIDRVEDLVAQCLARPDALRPWVTSAAANVATFGALYRFDFDEVRRLQDWAATYHRRNSGPLNVMLGHSYRGIAAYEQLDLAEAENRFRAALAAAKRSGGLQSHGARLAGSLLGELLYERGELAEAERLLDRGFELGVESGGVDFKLARYATGARVKALRGDLAESRRRLDAGARAARDLSLPRLRSRIENERVRLGFPTPPGFVPVEYPARRRPVDGIDEITAQVEEATAIRLLLAPRSPEQTELARVWAEEWVDRLRGRRRRRASLQATRLLAGCLAAAGRTDEAKATLAAVAATCAELGMVRYLPDGGPQLFALLAALREDQIGGRWRPEWPSVPSAFLVEVLSQDCVDTV